MYNSKNKIAHSMYALLLTVLFMSTFLVKPLHIIIAHHEIPDIAVAHSDHAILTNYENSNCPICNYEFCNFVSADFIEIQKAPEYFVDNITPQAIDCHILKSSHNFQLRGPPTL